MANPSSSANSWGVAIHSSRGGKINTAGVRALLSSSQVGSLLSDVANRSMEGSAKRYLVASRIPGLIAIRGRQPDRIGYKIEFKPEHRLLAADGTGPLSQNYQNAKRMTAMLAHTARKRVRTRNLSERKPRKRTYTTKKGS